jgi:alkylhydroperoxidase/carboxymuconolactone decarboxylase family protein YurZ
VSLPHAVESVREYSWSRSCNAREPDSGLGGLPRPECTRSPRSPRFLPRGCPSQGQSPHSGAAVRNPHQSTRPGLPRNTRSAITLTAMIAGGYWEELEMHIRAALRNGMTPDEIKEVFLQAAIYCSVPAANVAFGIGSRVIAEESP